MTRDELTDRILELFPPLGDVGEWRWDQTEAGEPITMIESHASFTGLDNGDVLLCGPIPDTRLIGVYRIKPDNRYALERLEDDPFAVEAAEHAALN
jgi:hypothetical protein